MPGSFPLIRLHVPSPGGAPARFSSPTSQGLSGASRLGEGEPPSPSELSAGNLSVTAGGQTGWSPPKIVERVPLATGMEVPLLSPSSSGIEERGLGVTDCPGSQ